MIIFEPILTTFDASNLFKAAGTTVKINSSLKTNHHSIGKLNQFKLVQIGDAPAYQE